jgi:hypothetical protein
MEGLYLGHTLVSVDAVSGYRGATVCTRTRITSSSFNSPTFYFRKGTDELVEVMGPVFLCSDSDPDLEALSWCQENWALQLSDNRGGLEGTTLHGFSWPEESGNEKDAVALSRQRVESMREWLRGANSPPVSESRIHGTSRTNIDRSSERRDPDIVIGGSLQLQPDAPIPQYQWKLGPPLSTAQYVRLARFLNNADSGRRVFSAHIPTIHTDFRPVSNCSPTDERSKRDCTVFWARNASYYSSLIDAPDATELDTWTTRMFNKACDVSQVGLPGDY